MENWNGELEWRIGPENWNGKLERRIKNKKVENYLVGPDGQPPVEDILRTLGCKIPEKLSIYVVKPVKPLEKRLIFSANVTGEDNDGNSVFLPAMQRMTRTTGTSLKADKLGKMFNFSARSRTSRPLPRQISTVSPPG
jgi:hypothetical protein